MKWMRRIDARDRQRVARLLDMLAAAPAPVAMPHGRRLNPDANLYELRPGGLRLYYTVERVPPVPPATEPTRRVLVLTYGNKDTQTQDIDRARSRQP